MRSSLRTIVVAFCFSLLSSCGGYPLDSRYDVVLLNGRVIDPESGLDAERHIGITDGRITRISETPLEGHRVIDAEGLVVAPGFIDIHAHGQDPISNRLQILDGVTTALEMEFGVFPVGAWLRSREGSALINYGATVGHFGARARLMHGVDVGSAMTLSGDETRQLGLTDSINREATDDEIDALKELLWSGLSEGGLGVGIGIGYVPGATRLEILRVFEVAADSGVAVYAHLRGPNNTAGVIDNFQEVIANAAITGASLHLVHLNSSANVHAKTALEMIRGARLQGLDVTTEAYPYTAGSTQIQAALFDAMEDRPDEDYYRLQWAATGERLNRELFEKYRAQGGYVIMHPAFPDDREALLEWIFAQPDVLVASDGIPFLYGPSHPRGAGTFSRTLGYYVRDLNVSSLSDALAKMTLLPAKRLEGASSQMRFKGRLQEGMDADITIFDPLQIGGLATYERSNLSSEGVRYVLVGGTVMVDEGEIVEGVFPGIAIRSN